MKDILEEDKGPLSKIPATFLAAHKHCINHRIEVLGSYICGCFYCGASFSPEKISEWIDKDVIEQGQTAVCPVCGIDSVIGDKSGFELTPEFLAKMREYWFDSD